MTPEQRINELVPQRPIKAGIDNYTQEGADLLMAALNGVPEGEQTEAACNLIGSILADRDRDVRALAIELRKALSAPAPIGKEEGSPALLSPLLAELNRVDEDFDWVECCIGAQECCRLCDGQVPGHRLHWTGTTSQAVNSLIDIATEYRAFCEAALAPAAPAAGASPAGGPADLKALVAVAAELDSLAAAATGPTPLASTTYVQALLRHRPALTQAIRALAAPSLLGGGVAPNPKGVDLAEKLGLPDNIIPLSKEHRQAIKEVAELMPVGPYEATQVPTAAVRFGVTSPVTGQALMQCWDITTCRYFAKVDASIVLGTLAYVEAIEKALEQAWAAAPTQVAIGGSGHD